MFLLKFAALLLLAGCHSTPRDPEIVVFLIQTRRRADYVAAQQILGRGLPAFNLWYPDTLVAHNRRLTNVVPSPSGSYTFLETAELKQD